MSGSYDYRVVALSVFVSILAAYASRELIGRVREARHWMWLAWLAGGATVDGIGTWSMHYTGMLAFNLPVEVRYDLPTVFASLAVGIVGSGGALLILSHRKIGWLRVLGAGILMGGVGISGLHYMAMAAMRFSGMHHYARGLPMLSIMVAIGMCSVTFALMFSRAETPRWGVKNHLGILLRGATNPAMHYTAMAGAVFVAAALIPDWSHAASISSLGVVGISIVPVMLLVVALLTTTVDRIHKQRALLDELFEQGPEAVALTDIDDHIIRVNRQFTQLFGYTPSDALGRHLADLIVPEESREEEQDRREFVVQRKRVAAEGVRKRKDGSRLNVHSVQVPVSLPSGAIEVYAIYQDITERKRAEAKLQHSREQLRSLTSRQESLREEERIRISREIHDDLGQRLTALKMDLGRIERKLGEMEASGKVNTLLDLVVGVIKATDEIVGQVQEIAAKLRPNVLDKLGLSVALQYEARRFQERTGVICEVRVPESEPPLVGELSTALFRIFQECLTNVARHAHATKVEVGLRLENASIMLSVSDNGRGIREAELDGAKALGLLGMRERAALFGGEIVFLCNPAGGTTVTVRIPIGVAGGSSHVGLEQRETES